MIDPAGRTHTLACAGQTNSIATRSNPAQSQSFAAELSDRLAATTKSSTVAVKVPVSQQNVARQDADVISRPTSSGTAGSATESAPQPSGLSGLVISYPSAAAAASSSTATTAASAQSGTSSFDQAYWASQPAAVQQLQDIPDQAQRTEVAAQLAQEGYTIDVPIMVWGWDPATTMAAREAMGYTWVPSALQQQVEVAPGLTFAGNSYNASNPPAGSITVS